MRETPLADIIQLVCAGGKSGVFHVQMDAYRAKIHLKDGKIVHALSNTNEGFEAVLDVALWLDGTYRFEEGPQDVPVTITKPNASVLMELGRRMDEWRVISQKITSVDLYPVSTALAGETPAGLNPRQAKLFPLLTGWYTVSELAEVQQKPVLTVAKDLYDMVMHGHLMMKGVRSGRPPKVEGVAPTPTPSPSPDSGAHAMPPPAPAHPAPAMSSNPNMTAPVTIGGGFASSEPPVQPRVPAPAVAQDPAKMAKLTAYLQRISMTAKMVLPPANHDIVDHMEARATQGLMAGEGAEAVKGFALAISKGAVDAGVDGEIVRNLNAQLKAIFAK
ncbi:MAG TPA: DUF4388 domain-containing protein [Holophagaceae bacterium]|nr:DUF4388 domain-containing protein [Holophagaceae bacterium]